MTKQKDVYNRLKEAISLLRRWDETIIPPYIWCEPGEDYDLPLDTQEFLIGKDTKPET